MLGFKAKFSGIYEWGVGWLSDEKRDAWRSFFRNLDDIFWSYHTSGNSEYLVTTGGCIYLHPMDVELALHVIGRVHSCKDGIQTEIFPEIDHLKEILTGVADACGGSVEFSDAKVYSIPDPEFNRDHE